MATLGMDEFLPVKEVSAEEAELQQNIRDVELAMEENIRVLKQVIGRWRRSKPIR